ncbi:MAG: septum site-determining protein MinD [Ruminococcaceae bacterium]|nr:septum site-determining protein MinD [Oscillospiraceae bacterium]
MGTVILVTSGKGGVGKSTLSALLGQAFSTLGKRTLIVELDAGLRCLDLFLGFGEDVVFDLADIFSGTCGAADAMIRVPSFEGLYVLPAPARADKPIPAERLAQACRSLASAFDLVLVDAPAGVGPLVRAAASAADRALIVTGADPLSSRDAYVTKELLTEAGCADCRLVINRVAPVGRSRKKLPDLDQIIDRAKVRLIGVLPESEQIRSSLLQGKPLPPESPEQQIFSAIAARLLGRNIPLIISEKSLQRRIYK